MADRELWKPDPGSPLVSVRRNEEVRAWYLKHLAERAEQAGGGPDAFGHERKEFARAWVRLASELGLKKPGEDRRTPLAGEDPLERQYDAAHTRLRQFQEGHNEFNWVLAGIESVLCDRAGLALPGDAYNTQQRLL